MKTINQLTVLLSMLIALSITAQQGINYKALVKDGSGNVVASQSVDVQFIIYQGPGEATNVYQETHTPNTDANGIVIVNIGKGTTSDVFADIDWGSDDHYLNVQIDTGSGLTDMGTTQFMAVPYALNVSKESIKIDDLIDGKSDNDGTENGSSLFLGVDAGLNDDASDNQNVGIGFETLKNNTTGTRNVANGSKALTSNTTGANNTAIGGWALFSNTTAHNNTAIGHEALMLNTTGALNVAIGVLAMKQNITGHYNVAIGPEALEKNTIGIHNVAIGRLSINSNTEGNYNTANGERALFSNTIGSFNTAIGREALMLNTTGLYNTAIGIYALRNNTTGRNNTAIGNNAQVPDDTVDNQVRIGNDQVDYAGIQVAWTVTSDKRWKENIRELPFGLDVVKELNPVDYVRKNNEHKTREMGFIAQDVESLLTK